MKKTVTLLVCLGMILLVLGLLPVHGEEEIYDEVVRLHVLAHSDEEEDQALKLVVRDRVLACSADLLEGVEGREAAEETLRASLETLCYEAQKCIWEEGFDYAVEVVLGKEKYPTREYESFCFPSGEYLSLQVRIGEAKGTNWWCVLFPPMCLSAATEANDGEDAWISAGFTGEQYKIITQTDQPTYRIRFKVLEALERITR